MQRPARGPKSPSIQAFRSIAARRGPAGPGRVCPAPHGKARAGGHRRRAPRPTPLGGAWLVLKSTIRTSDRRHHQPVDLPGNQRRRPARPRQPADDRDLGAAAGRKHLGKSCIGDQAEHAAGQRRALGLGPIGGIAVEIALARRRAVARRRRRAAIAAAGAPACRAAARARARGSIRRCGRDGLRPRPGSEGRSRLSAGASGGAEVRSHDGSAIGAAAQRA